LGNIGDLKCFAPDSVSGLGLGKGKPTDIRYVHSKN